MKNNLTERLHRHAFFQGLARLFVLAALSTIAVGPLEARGSMYICRGKSGAMNFTNAPVGSNCQIYSLTQDTGFSASFGSGGGGGGDSKMYDMDIHRIGRRYQVDPPLIKAIILAESDFDHRAVSRKGALGLMQLMPETARELRVGNPFNPRENIDGGTRYLRQLLDNFNGNLSLSLAAYNAGPGLVSRTGGVPDIPETQQYVTKVLKHYKEYKRVKGISPLLVKE
ncbi:MAG: lytic transglycosylase domain-containing protein [Desulforhopalus sp.]|nr:lytic transglycosylase domain-containing protein [Desulforhopalus sp.]